MGHEGVEFRLIMLVICGMCALGPLSAAFPVVEQYAGIGVGALAVLLALASLGYVGREVRRELLFRAEMRALDRRDAARARQQDWLPQPPNSGEQHE